MSKMSLDECRLDRARERGEVRDYDVDLIITVKKTLTVEATSQHRAEQAIKNGDVDTEISDEDISEIEISNFTVMPVLLSPGGKSAVKYLKEKGYDIKPYPKFFLLNGHKIER